MKTNMPIYCCRHTRQIIHEQFFFSLPLHVLRCIDNVKLLIMSDEINKEKKKKKEEKNTTDSPNSPSSIKRSPEHDKNGIMTTELYEKRAISTFPCVYCLMRYCNYLDVQHVSIFSSPEPKAQVSYCHRNLSGVRPSVRPSVC